MADKIQWKEPAEITERKLREETEPMLRQMVKQCTRYFLMAGIPISILCFFVNRSVLVMALPLLALAIYQIPLLIWINIRQGCKSGVKHQVGRQGIQENQRLWSWRQVEGYNFSDSSQLSDVGDLNIKVRPYKGWRSLPFYRCDVDEQELRIMMERFAPQSEPLLNKPSLRANLERRKQKVLHAK